MYRLWRCKTCAWLRTFDQWLLLGEALTGDQRLGILVLGSIWNESFSSWETCTHQRRWSGATGRTRQRRRHGRHGTRLWAQLGETGELIHRLCRRVKHRLALSNHSTQFRHYSITSLTIYHVVLKAHSFSLVNIEFLILQKLSSLSVCVLEIAEFFYIECIGQGQEFILG